jgi:F-type H+-transporting ATPase subunit alpha
MLLGILKIQSRSFLFSPANPVAFYLGQVCYVTKSAKQRRRPRTTEKLKRRPYRKGDFGQVISVADGVVVASGLERARSSEVVLFSGGLKGMLVNLERDTVGIIVLGDTKRVSAGDIVYRTGKELRVPVGFTLLGRVLDAMGNPIDGGAPLNVTTTAPVEVKAPSVVARAPIREPLETGVKAVDILLPLGRGQRELIIGDRQTGKTAVAIDALLHQSRLNVVNPNARVYCIYVAIGIRQSQVIQLHQTLRDLGALDTTIIVAATASDSPALQYIAPYSATAMAEFFRDNGMHALIIYDDLSKHAVAYRQMSLLLRRPPGREAFPGDVFYLHSRLLERAAKMSRKLGGGSLTALPIVETQSGDVSAYIPTNVISITDGQIYLDSYFFYRGLRPAINVGISVSRVGAAAQPKGLRKYASTLKLELAQYRETLLFTRFGGEIDDATRELLDRGRIFTDLLNQPQYNPIPVEFQILSLFGATEGYFNHVLEGKFVEVETALHNFVKNNRILLPFVQTLTEEEDEEVLHVIMDLFFNTMYPTITE